MLALMILAGAGAALVVGRTLDAPDWLRERIEARIVQTLPGIGVGSGNMSLRIERNGVARVILWDVDIRNARGEPIATLSDFEAGFAPAGLIRGQLELREAHLSGAFLTVTRSPDGTLGLALGDAFAAGTQAPDLGALIEQIDAAFADPRLAQLDSVSADGLTIRYEDLRARRGWTVDGGRLRVSRDADVLDFSGDLALLSGGDGVASIEVNAASPIGARTIEFGVNLRDLAARDIASQSAGLAWLESLEAPISGALRSELRADGSLGVLNATLQIGAGALQPNAATRAIPFEAARTYFTYDPERALLDFAEITVRSPLGAVTAAGQAALLGTQSARPEAISGQLRLSEVHLAKDTPLLPSLDLAGADAAFKLTLQPFELTLGDLTSRDETLPLRSAGRLLARPDGWQVSLDAHVARTDPAQVLTFWPASFRTRARDWVAQNVTGGNMRDITFALRAEPGGKPMTYIDFGFDGGHVSYNPRLPPVTGGRGRVTIYDHRLSVRLEAGRIVPAAGGALDVGGSEFIMPDLRTRPNPALLNLRARGPLGAVLSYVDNDAWQLLRKAGRGLDLATGQAEITGRVALPLRRGLTLADVDLDLEGVLRDVRSETIARARVLEAERLAFALDNDRLEIRGPVTLSGAPAEGRFEMPLDGGASRLTATVQLSQRTLDRFRIALPDGMISGQGTGTLALDMARGAAPRFVLESDLAGIGVAIPQLGWRLRPNQTGQFRIIGTLGTPVTIDSLSLTGAGLEARGGLSLTDAGGLRSLRFDTLKVGDWLDVRARLDGRGAGVAPGVEIAGGTLDLRRAPFGNGAGGARGGGGAVPMKVALDRLQVTNTIALTRFAGEFEAAGALDGRFTARIDGKSPIEGRLTAQGGASAVRIVGADAGDILEDAGLLKTVQNGDFSLELTPVRGRAGQYDGRLLILGARLREAPAIAALLDAVSVVGLIDQLNGPGIFFAEVEAFFRLTPNRVILTRSSAVGPSMGISLDGFYDLDRGEMDLQGVLSPIYVLNGIGRLIARKGEGLIGFNFNLQGPVSAPRVLVNPLSVFTPGMFRDIFRRPPPQVSQ
ncbi:hypothetical protein J1C49_03330 [Cognatishimia sp. F0-27]|nr:hypothetical protein [Cognatishimia sp. F0-27]